MDRILLEDVESIAKSQLILWEELKGRTVFVTGATGLIGSQIIWALEKYNELFGGEITVYALVRSIDKAKRILGNCSDRVHMVIGDVTDEINVAADIDYIIHGASITSSKSFVELPVETILTAINGTNNILRFARDKKVKSFVYMSSLEVYGVTDPTLRSVEETEYGYIDPLVPRSSYSESKRMAECLCISYGCEYNIPVKVVRLAQTFGPGVSYTDNRVFAQFARCVIENKDIVLRTMGETHRNYCYTKDAVIGILCVMINGENNLAYNIANNETAISIRDMAKMVAHDIAEDKIKVIFDIAKDVAELGYGPTIKIELDTTRIQKLGWSAAVNLEHAFCRMITSMRDSQHE